jgi:hypothetical protein
MSNRIKGKSAINKLGIASAVNNKCFLNSLTGGIKDGAGYYLVNGVEVPSNELERLYPTETSPMLVKGKNPNTTKI